MPMLEELLLTVELDVPFEAFARLPRHPAYKYEYFGGRAVPSPWPHYVEACWTSRAVLVTLVAREKPFAFRG
jgi:hypothetical protein